MREWMSQEVVNSSSHLGVHLTRLKSRMSPRYLFHLNTWTEGSIAQNARFEVDNFQESRVNEILVLVAGVLVMFWFRWCVLVRVFWLMEITSTVFLERRNSFLFSLCKLGHFMELPPTFRSTCTSRSQLENNAIHLLCLRYYTIVIEQIDKDRNI